MALDYSIASMRNPAHPEEPSKWYAFLQYPQAAIHGHRDFSVKACPCFNATTEYQEILPNK